MGGRLFQATAREKAFYEVIAAIPDGRIVTYGQVAMLAGWPKNSRQVGFVLRQSSSRLSLPWHRVLSKRSPKFAAIVVSPKSTATEQARRLSSEGVCVSSSGIVSLHDFGWLPTGA